MVCCCHRHQLLAQRIENGSVATFVKSHACFCLANFRSGLVAAELEKIKQFKCILTHEDECSLKLLSSSSEEGHAVCAL